MEKNQNQKTRKGANLKIDDRIIEIVKILEEAVEEEKREQGNTRPLPAAIG